MDQLRNVRRINTNTCTTPGSSRARNSPTFEQLLHVSDSSTPRDDFGHPQKKSVLSKVKEKAKKLKRSLSLKKRDQDNNNNNFQEDYEEEGDRQEDREYHGGVPVSYKTEMARARAPFKETTLQKPRTVSLVSDKHILATKVNHDGQGDEAPSQLQLTKPSLKSPDYNETVSEMSGPTYADAANSNTVASEVSYRKSKSTVSESSSMWENESLSSTPTTSSWKKTWVRSFSMKEYFMQKLEPGEDAKALSNVITEVISPKKSSHGGGETTTGGVVEKVKEAVNSLLTVKEEDQIPQRTQDERVVISFPASPIPVSTNAHEYYNEEETQGRIL